MIQLSGIALKNEAGELLLLHNIKNGFFQFPGGKVENGEALEETAIREAHEELGCEVKLAKYLKAYRIKVHGHEYEGHLFEAKLLDDCTPKINEPDKFDQLLWLDMKDHRKYPCAPNVIEFCEEQFES